MSFLIFVAAAVKEPLKGQEVSGTDGRLQSQYEVCGYLIDFDEWLSNFCLTYFYQMIDIAYPSIRTILVSTGGSWIRSQDNWLDNYGISTKKRKTAYKFKSTLKTAIYCVLRVSKLLRVSPFPKTSTLFKFWVKWIWYRVVSSFTVWWRKSTNLVVREILELNLESLLYNTEVSPFHTS